MPKCEFISQYNYYDYEIREWVTFYCKEIPLASGHCIFHDNDYLQDRTDNEEHKRAVLDRLKRKVNHAISNNEPLLCIGFRLPDFLSDFGSKEFTKSVYFSEANFKGEANFSSANFKGGAGFSNANFQEEADFYEAKFKGEARFYEAKFKFKGEAGFSRANFHGEARFYEAKFKGEAYFSEANFKGGAYFSEANFQEEAVFTKANFQGKASFSDVNFQLGALLSNAKFKGEVDFSNINFQLGKFKGEVDFYNFFQFGGDFDRSEFYGKTYFSGYFGFASFNYVLFEGKEKVIFDIVNLSNVSLMNTDITGVRFSDKARWGEKKVEYDKFWGGQKIKEDRFKIVDERILEEEIKDKDGETKDINLGSIKAVYRSLRENYEYRMRYDEAGQFFIREMELKRMYREVPSKEESSGLEIKQNKWFRRNLFSLTGLYYHLSRYGESLWRPALAGLVIVFLSTLFWVMQSNPTVEPSLFPTVCYTTVISDAARNNTSKFIGLCEYGIRTYAHWLKAFERSLADFLPLLPTGDFKMGIIDFVIKIIGGAVTFGLLAIALRRRFERRYRH